MFMWKIVNYGFSHFPYGVCVCVKKSMLTLAHTRSLLTELTLYMFIHLAAAAKEDGRADVTRRKRAIVMNVQIRKTILH